MAVNDLLTVAEARRPLGIGPMDTSSDTELAEVISEASMYLDDLCGPIVRRDVTETFLEPSGAVFLRVPPGSPTFSVTFASVTEYAGGVAAVLTAEDFDTAGGYRYDPRLGRLLRRSSWLGTAWGRQEVVVAYNAGRFGDTASVSQTFKGACRQVAAQRWQARGRTIAVGAPSGGEGPPGFAGIPYSPATLLKNLRATLGNELLVGGLA